MLHYLIIKDLSESTINNLGSTPGLITERVWGGNRAANGQLLPIIPCHTYSYILHITRQLFLMINKILFRSSEGKWSHLCYCHPAFLPEPPSIVILFIFFIIFLFYFLSYFYFIILYHLIFLFIFIFYRPIFVTAYLPSFQIYPVLLFSVWCARRKAFGAK